MENVKVGKNEHKVRLLFSSARYCALQNKFVIERRVACYVERILFAQLLCWFVHVVDLLCAYYVVLVHVMMLASRPFSSKIDAPFWGATMIFHVVGFDRSSKTSKNLFQRKFKKVQRSYYMYVLAS